LVRLFLIGELKQNEYALVKLEFFKEDNFLDNLLVEANSRGLLIDTKTLRNYFGIEWGKNIGDIIMQFNERLASFIPKEVSAYKSDIQKKAMVHSLSLSDSENPDRVYCSYVKRNPFTTRYKFLLLTKSRR